MECRVLVYKCKGTDDLSNSSFSKVRVAGGRLKWVMERMGREKHQGIYCEQNERKHSRGCEGRVGTK